MYTLYILKSKKFDKTYVGITSNLITRFHAHNTYSKKGWTKNFRPWKVIYTEQFIEKREALAREKWFKSGIGRRFIKDNIAEWSSW